MQQETLWGALPQLVSSNTWLALSVGAMNTMKGENSAVRIIFMVCLGGGGGGKSTEPHENKYRITPRVMTDKHFALMMKR